MALVSEEMAQRAASLQHTFRRYLLYKLKMEVSNGFKTKITYHLPFTLTLPNPPSPSTDRRGTRDTCTFPYRILVSRYFFFLNKSLLADSKGVFLSEEAYKGLLCVHFCRDCTGQCMLLPNSRVALSVASQWLKKKTLL